MALVENIKTAMDELRMQMLGLQVLFGFQFRGLFQPTFSSLPRRPSAPPTSHWRRWPLALDAISSYRLPGPLDCVSGASWAPWRSAWPWQARVVLPGAQALLGFQMIVMLTPAFRELPSASRYLHLVALFVNVLSIVLLICPAAVHRMSFGGKDTARMHTIGSGLIAAALAPMALGISLDFYVAMARLFTATALAGACAATGFLLMMGSWYGAPLYIRSRLNGWRP